MHFMEVTMENTQAKHDARLPFGSEVEKFLRSRDVRLSVHAAFHDEPKSLERVYDLDGAVVEVYCFASIKGHMPYLYLNTSHVVHPTKYQ